MKKLLLLAAAGMIASSAMAVTDGCTYQSVNGFTCKNQWVDDRVSNLSGWNALPFASMYAKARTATLWDDAQGKTKVVVGFSKTITEGESSDDYATLVFIDIITGAVEKEVQMTLNGEPIKGQLCANQVGCDGFNNLWFAGLVSSMLKMDGDNVSGSNELKIFKVDNVETGACSLAAALTLPEDDWSADNQGRVDYCDVCGDITLKQGPCTVIAAPANGGCVVYGWGAAQNGTWGPKMNGGDYGVGRIEETYPAGQTSWGTAPTAYIIRDEEFTGEMFYVDGFTTCPALYTTEGSMIGSFAEATDLAPKVGTNGVSEFTLAGKPFIVYSMDQYVGTPPCQISVCELGEGSSFEGMQRYWTLPENGLGDVSDGGTRYHGIGVRHYPDASGKDGIYLVTYKCNNGLGVYAIGEAGWQDPNSAGVADMEVADENAAVEYFNLQGVAVDEDNLTPGLYITRQGSKTSKKVVK